MYRLAWWQIARMMLAVAAALIAYALLFTWKQILPEDRGLRIFFVMHLWHCLAALAAIKLWPVMDDSSERCR